MEFQLELTEAIVGSGTVSFDSIIGTHVPMETARWLAEQVLKDGATIVALQQELERLRRDYDVVVQLNSKNMDIASLYPWFNR